MSKIAEMVESAREIKSERCASRMKHKYEYLFLYLMAKEGGFRILKCCNCGEIIKERIEEEIPVYNEAQ